MIDFVHFNFSYQEKTLFKEVNISLNPNQIYLVYADNGKGKSTLFKILIGIEKQYTGNILIDHVDIRTLSIKKVSECMSICLSSQPMSSLTVRELFEFSDIKLDEKSIELWELTPWLEVSLDTMSEGERQWIYIARAVLSGTKIVLLDEPTAFLDRTKRIKLMELLNHYAEKDKLIVVNTHDEKLLELKSRTVLEIKDQKLMLNNP